MCPQAEWTVETSAVIHWGLSGLTSADFDSLDSKGSQSLHQLFNEIFWYFWVEQTVKLARCVVGIRKLCGISESILAVIYCSYCLLWGGGLCLRRNSEFRTEMKMMKLMMMMYTPQQKCEHGHSSEVQRYKNMQHESVINAFRGWKWSHEVLTFHTPLWAEWRMSFPWQHFHGGPIINLKQSKLNMLNMEMHNHKPQQN